MEKRKTIFDYLGQIFMFFGITVAVLGVFSVLFGEQAKEISTMFSHGRACLSVRTMAEYLLVCTAIIALRYLFFTDALIKNMSVPIRTACMILSVLVTIICAVLTFDWFPADMWQPWAIFFASFAVCFGISMFVIVIKEKEENKKMQEALTRLQEWDKTNI